MSEHVCVKCGAGLSCEQAWTRVEQVEKQRDTLNRDLAETRAEVERLREERARTAAAIEMTIAQIEGAEFPWPREVLVQALRELSPTQDSEEQR